VSWQVGQFGVGFSLSSLSSSALRFISLLNTRGTHITVIVRTKTVTRDSYGHPTYTESNASEHAMVQREPKNVVIMPGNLEIEKTVLYMSLLAYVSLEDEILLDAQRYVVHSIEKTDAYQKVTTERRIDN